jgi:hypothetical protein
MTVNRGERTPLRSEDEEFAERLSASFSPAPLSPAQRAAFDAALAERLARRPSRLLVPVLAGAAAAAAVALAWLLAPGAFDSAPTGRAGAGNVVADASDEASWELELLDPNALTNAGYPEDAEPLPADYAAIAGIFLDG